MQIQDLSSPKCTDSMPCWLWKQVCMAKNIADISFQGRTWDLWSNSIWPIVDFKMLSAWNCRTGKSTKSPQWTPTNAGIHSTPPLYAVLSTTQQWKFKFSWDLPSIPNPFLWVLSPGEAENKLVPLAVWLPFGYNYLDITRGYNYKIKGIFQFIVLFLCLLFPYTRCAMSPPKGYISIYRPKCWKMYRIDSWIETNGIWDIP